MFDRLQSKVKVCILAPVWEIESCFGAGAGRLVDFMNKQVTQTKHFHHQGREQKKILRSSCFGGWGPPHFPPPGSALGTYHA